jgi:hypothetical protein
MQIRDDSCQAQLQDRPSIGCEMVLDFVFGVSVWGAVETMDVFAGHLRDDLKSIFDKRKMKHDVHMIIRIERCQLHGGFM